MRPAPQKKKFLLSMKRIGIVTFIFLLLLGVGVSRSPHPNLLPPLRGAGAAATETTPPEPPAHPQPGDTWTNPEDGAAMVFIPVGHFYDGSDRPEVDALWQKFGWPEEWKGDTITRDETPQHPVKVKGFWIGRYEVINEQFARFVEATGYRTDAEKAGAAWVVDFEKPSVENFQGANWKHHYGPESDLKGRKTSGGAGELE
jgi:formylglycine-generating enzyme required for sulfatase activity